jgi:drug/metabolite transporter (DMT)-like permease
VFAAILLGEEPSWLQIVGAAVILTGLIVASAGRRSRLPEPVFEHA